jgi:hypothetical protein
VRKRFPLPARRLPFAQRWGYAEGMTQLPLHTKLVLALLAFVPLCFITAALGTKIEVWPWTFGLMTLTLGAG